MRRLLAAALLVLLPALGMAASNVGGDSLYVMKLSLTDQAGVTTALDRFGGSPVLISMFYGNCSSACPLLISGLQQMESRLPPAQRAKLRVLLVSVDAEHDTPEKLAHFAAMHHVDEMRWALARTDARSVRRLAAALGIQYRQQPDGEFNHSTVITLLDAAGRPLGHTSRLLARDEDFEAGVLKALAN